MVADCHECPFLSVTEAEQNRQKTQSGELPNHMCTIEGKRLLHDGRHPQLLVPHWCPIIPKLPTKKESTS